ncbi:hypothetical protein ONE63_007459 [Megalurothrips usitatus]|uniref:Uncharacterized protein n=1 Tax=Megalurothrips usitatus TaxID=439358 RepID=A0AAV7XR53_9NEOP|nr:hypothetical protein ONE63_007459 [Megalurothrips usitatus]
MAKCSAPNCLNSQKRDSLEYSFHEFPHDSDLRARWIANIGRPNWTPGRRSMICSSHFEKSQLKRKGQHNHLLEGAVPTLFQLSRSKRARINKGKDLSSNVQPIPPRNSSNLDESCVSVSIKETNHPSEIKNVSEVVNTDLIYEPNAIKHEEKPAPEKLPDGYVYVDFTLKDCEVVEANFQDKNTGTATDGSSTKSNNYSVAGRQENDENIESMCEAVFKQVLNLTNIATPRAFIDASNSDMHMLDSMPVSDLGAQTITVPPVKRCKLSVKQGDILLVDDPSKLILEKSEEFTLDGTELVSADNFVREIYSEPADQLLELNKSERPTSLSIKRGVVDVPVSLKNHKLGGCGRNHSHSSYNWLDGTFMCRLCGVASNKTINLFSDEASEVKVLERIYSILPITIMESDHLPQNVCSQCLSRLDICSELIVSSFNTQEQLASVMDQGVKQSCQMPVSFHGKEIRTSHNPNWKKHILLMEIYHEQEKPLNEYLSIAYHDLHARLNPETRETQCNLVLATITDNCSVSQVEQVRTAAEALVSSELIHEETNEETKLFHHGADTVDEHENDEVCSELSGGVSARLPSAEHFQYDEHCPTEIQAMPVVDDASPVEFDPANVRCTKFRHFKNDYEICFNNMQNLIYWGMSEDKEVHPACSICKKGFDKQSDIQKHLLSHANMHTHLEENLDITRQVESTSHKVWKSIHGKRFCPWYQCSFCSERCKTRLLLKQHLQQQHAANAKCEACGYVSSDVCESTNHRQVCPQLKKEKDWRCRKCLESFSSQMDLQTHQANSGHENNVPSWLCDVCGKRYAQAAKLNQHKKSHLTSEIKCIHQCPICPKRYINSSRLKEHMQKHEEKKYMCKVCGKLFSTKQILRQHEFTHGDPQFMCSLCSRTFFRKSHLLKHMNVHNPANIR